MFLRADGAVAYNELMKVMNLLREAGYLKIALVGLEDTGQAVARASGRAGGGDEAMRIDWRDPDGRPEGAVTRATALRWTAAGLAVVAVHAGGIWLALNWPAAAEAPGDPPAAIMMELAPLAVAPEVPQQDIAPGPEMDGGRGAGRAGEAGRGEGRARADAGRR